MLKETVSSFLARQLHTIFGVQFFFDFCFFLISKQQLAVAKPGTEYCYLWHIVFFFAVTAREQRSLRVAEKLCFFFFLRGGWFKKVFCGVGKRVYFDSSVFLYRGLQTPVIWEKRNTIAMFVLRNFSHRASARVK